MDTGYCLSRTIDSITVKSGLWNWDVWVCIPTLPLAISVALVSLGLVASF